jgi:ankyrin repeat protein
VRALIEAGAGVRKPEIGGRALQLAQRKSTSTSCAALMDARAPLGFSGWENEPPLHAAAAAASGWSVEALLEAGLDPDQLDRGGQTALMKAAASGHEKAVGFPACVWVRRPTSRTATAGRFSCMPPPILPRDR